MIGQAQPLEANRRQWFAMLAVLVNPTFAPQTGAALCAMLPYLRDLPEELFTDDSARHVARWKRRQPVPSFDELEAALEDFRRTFLSTPTPRPCIASPNASLPPFRTLPSAEELAYVANLVRPWTQIEQPQAGSAMPEPPAARLRDVSLQGETLRRSREARGIKPVTS